MTCVAKIIDKGIKLANGTYSEIYFLSDVNQSWDNLK